MKKYGSTSGVLLASRYLAKKKTQGSLTDSQQQEFFSAFAELSNQEKDDFSFYIESGFCRICDAGGIVSPAGHGPFEDLCFDCWKQVSGKFE